MITVANLVANLKLKPDKNSFKAADQMLGYVKKALVAIVAYKTAAFFGNLFQDTVQAGDQLDELAQKTGIGTTALQELGYAAQFSGISQDQLGSAIGKMSKQILAARDGSEEAQRAFRRVGVSWEMLKKGNPDEILAKVADTFKDMPDGPRKSALAMQVFGKSGADLIPFLNAGSEGIARLRKEAQDLGIVIGEGTVKEMAEFADTQDRVKSVLTGLRNEGVKAILPYIREVTQEFFEWVKSNRDLIKVRIEQFVKVLIIFLKALVKTVKVVTKIFGVLADNIDLVIVGVIALTAAYVILNAAAIAAAISAALAWAAALLPITLLAAAIAAVILVLKSLWNWFAHGEGVIRDAFYAVKEFLGNVHEWLVDAFVTAIEVITGFFVRLFDWILEKIKAIPGALADAASGVVDYLNPFSDDDNIASAVNAGFAASLDPVRSESSYPQPAGNVTQDVKTDITVNVPPGTDPNQVGQIVRDEFDRNWDRNVRQTAAVTGVY